MQPNTETLVIEHRYDRWLLAIVLALMGFGLVMVYSASIVSADHHFGDPTFFLRKQVVHVVIGLIVMVGFMNLPHHALERYAGLMLAIVVCLLLLVLVPGISTSAKGASRWLNLGLFKIQPSEFVKFGFMVFMAQYLSRNQVKLNSWRVTWFVPIAVMIVIGAFLMRQPDFGSTILCGLIMTLMVFAAGCPLKQVFAIGAVSIGLIVLAVTTQAYRMKRVMTFLNPDSDPLGAGYQINQALISFGSGDMTGLGLGGSRQKLMYLPDAHTDFIFSIIGEELGLLGGACLLALFLALIWRGVHIARTASSSFGALMAFGVTALIAAQACINMGVVMALLPTKGLTLPFISYGGSSMIVLCASIGLLLNISQRTPPPGWLHSKGYFTSKLDLAEAYLQRILQKPAQIGL
jgi:cell division protein FtsW